jgi:exonuclease SbcC
LEKSLPAVPEKTLLQAQEDVALLTMEKKRAVHEKEGIIARLSPNRLTLDNLCKNIVTLKNLEEKYSWMKALSDTANGTLRGKEKVRLETYVQKTYLERILIRANRRLRIMTDDQYELKCREEAESKVSKSGLELNVIDHYNGTERDVRSLSGGESFKASLALALGLSDEIQASAGGIRLDTMFVDEGFGSLDDASLDYAMRALSDLTEGGRLVGIISHVGALKDKITRQVIVKKEKDNGSTVTVTV